MIQSFDNFYQKIKEKQLLLYYLCLVRFILDISIKFETYTNLVVLQ